MTAKKIPMPPSDASKEKALYNFSTFISFQTYVVDEGYAAGEDQIL